MLFIIMNAIIGYWVSRWAFKKSFNKSTKKTIAEAKLRGLEDVLTDEEYRQLRRQIVNEMEDVI